MTTAAIDTALAIRKGSLRLSAVPEKERADVRAALRNEKALIARAREVRDSHRAPKNYLSTGHERHVRSA